MNLHFQGARMKASPELVPQNWAGENGNAFTLSGNRATGGASAGTPDNVYGPVLPNADCYWYVQMVTGFSGFIGLLGVARGDLIPANVGNAGISGLYWSGSIYRDGSSVSGTMGNLTAGLYKFAVRQSNSTLYLRNVTTASAINTVLLPSGFSFSNLVPCLTTQAGFASCTADLYAARLGSGDLY